MGCQSFLTQIHKLTKLWRIRKKKEREEKRERERERGDESVHAGKERVRGKKKRRDLSWQMAEPSP